MVSKYTRAFEMKMQMKCNGNHSGTSNKQMQAYSKLTHVQRQTVHIFSYFASFAAVAAGAAAYSAYAARLSAISSSNIDPRGRGSLKLALA